mgnify:CR=1 FL=1
MLLDKIALAQAVCTRLCHDLGGAAGALAGALDLLDGAGDDALDVARDASRILDRRIRFYRAAIGAVQGADLHARRINHLTDTASAVVLVAYSLRIIDIAELDRLRFTE